MPRVNVIVKKGGKVIMEGVDYSDASCLEDLKALLERVRAYGVEVNIEELIKKPEAHVPVVQAEEEKAKQEVRW